MKREPSGYELQSLLDAIKVSDVVENRIQLIAELGELDITNETERASLLECLTIFWEDFTCLDVSQCMLNKTILQVVTSYLESDITRCLSQLLALGAKASIWCRKHLKMTIMSTDDSQEEEHFGTFFQVLLDMLHHSAATLSALARHPVSTRKELMVIVETSIMEFLNLTKDSILEVKRIHTFGSEVLKAAQVVLDGVIRLCRVYCNDVKLDMYDVRRLNVNNDCEEADTVNHAINITRCTVENLCGLGILAANDGGNLVSVLNLSWKGVVTLLQLGKETLAIKLNIAEIILSLISLANGSLRCAAETWSLSMEAVPVTEAKRIFIPVKFYLINAARIVSHYPSQAFSVFKDITLCILMILAFRILLGKDELLKSASEALVELLEPTSFHLLNSLLNSAQVKQKHKSQILDWLFGDITESNFVSGDQCSLDKEKSMDAIFCVTCSTMHESKILLLGRVALFINLLRSAPDLEDDVKLEIAKKLEWLLNILIDEDVYSFILVLPVPVLRGSGPMQEGAYQTMLSSIIHSLKTFMLVVSSTLAWREAELFLLENFFHPHPLCWEIVLELWCFMVRHAETDLGNDIVDKLCTLLRTMTSSESALVPGSAVRKLARSICMLLTCGSRSMADRVFNFIINTNGSKLSSTMYIALLMEGFPLNFLSDKVRSVANQRIVTEYYGFLESFDDESSKQYGYGIFGAPVFALSAALQSRQVSISDTEMKTVKLLIAIIRKYTGTVDNFKKNHYRKLLSETLGIISRMKHLYPSDEMEKIISELQTLFISDSSVTDTGLFQCKPNLAAFVAGLGHIELEETNTDAKVSAAWQLFHMLLKERHWALAHLSLTAFGYFSAHTNCNELWRFVPQDAALSYDLELGNDANEERFMSEFKVFLEKESVDLKPTPTTNELGMLFKEGLILKEMTQKMTSIDTEAITCDTHTMQIDHTKQTNKRRKFPDGISEGVSLLQSGLKVLANGLTQWQQNQLDYADLHTKFLTHFSHLEDAVGHLASIAETE